MRYRVRVRVVRYLDMLIHASSVHSANRIGLEASERVPHSQWEVYKAIHCPDNGMESNVELKVVGGRPPARQSATESEVGEKKGYQVRVMDCRWCDLVIEARSKKAAIRHAACMDVSAIAPPSKWDGYTSTETAEDDLEPGF